MRDVLLSVDDLSIAYRTGQGSVHALRHASLKAHAGEVVGIMGESGCGKSTLASAIINLLNANAEVTSGAVRLKGSDILTLPRKAQRAIRGRHIAMVFQDPMTSLNPVFTIGTQLVDFQYHLENSAVEKMARAEAMVQRVGIPDPALCLRLFPHELSGGMRQRVSIAAALLMQPEVLVADEPTTALDVTMEAQIIHLLRELRNDYDGAIIVVTHHLGVIAELCDTVYVMYAGEVVEAGPVMDIFHAPVHPYTRALIACDPAHLEEETGALPTIPGRVPDLAHLPAGCSFADRCGIASDRCRETPPPWVNVTPLHGGLCHKISP
ncbi:ABC transporter ATP-binding protein [Aestuariivirga sp.]|uniref:ABC transporter ATP-binding protein n=1 Tax=Aestuariivirga sp. TaxID=2650926 RepID=UPI0039E2DC9C